MMFGFRTQRLFCNAATRNQMMNALILRRRQMTKISFLSRAGCTNYCKKKCIEQNKGILQTGVARCVHSEAFPDETG